MSLIYWILDFVKYRVYKNCSRNSWSKKPLKSISQLYFADSYTKRDSHYNSWYKYFLHDIPALLSSTSSFPWRAMTVSKALATCSSSVTSHLMKCAAEPSSVVTIRPASSSISTIMAWAPWFTNSSAVAFPRPLAPPVMTATLPSNLLIFICGKRIHVFKPEYEI